MFELVDGSVRLSHKTCHEEPFLEEVAQHQRVSISPIAKRLELINHAGSKLSEFLLQILDCLHFNEEAIQDIRVQS